MPQPRRPRAAIQSRLIEPPQAVPPEDVVMEDTELAKVEDRNVRMLGY